MPASSPVLSISIVVFQSDLQILQQTLDSLLVALDSVLPHQIAAAQLRIICNDQRAAALDSGLQLPPLAGLSTRIEDASGNIGYGAAHNIAIEAAHSDFHLILNPDVILDANGLRTGLAFLAEHDDVAAVSPRVTDNSGEQQFLCKRFPSLLDFLLRGFAPELLRRRFSQRLAHYEMRDLPSDRPARDIPIISGCFMLFRTSTLQQLRGFDPDYFLYFEDFDLSLRAARQGSLAYLPAMRIVHLGGNSARKGLRHIMLFARSAIRFYNTWGWRLW